MSLSRFFAALLRRFPGRILAATGLLTFASVLEMAGLAAVIPILSRFVDGAGLMDGSLGQAMSVLGIDSLSLEALLLLLVAVIVVRSVLQFGAGTLVGKVAVSIERQFRHDLMEHYLRADWIFHIEQAAGRITSLISRETWRARSAVINAGTYYSLVLMAGAFLVAGLLVSWQALAVSLLIGSLLIVATIQVNRLSRQGGIKLIGANSRFSGTVIESLGLAKYIKGSAIEDQTLAKFDRAVDDVAGLAFRQIVYREFVRNYPDVIGVSIIGILVYLTYTFSGSVGGNLLFFLLLALRASSKIASMQSARRMAMQNIPSYEACMALLDEAHSRRESPDGQRFERLRKGVELRDVGFAYPRSPSTVVSGVNLAVDKTSMVALVGRSGAGKTTIVDIVLGLLRPDTGAVLVDGIDLRSYDIGSWRRKVGFVPQEPVLFNAAIVDNILIARPDASLDQVRRAAAMAHATEFIDALPQGYDTVVGDRGIKLSGGQKQRIALARALLRDPEVLVLDEATSSLDTESERSIQQAILSLKGRMTVIVIAHRLSTVEKADRIFVIKDGRVSESGDFEELTAKGGEFARLHALSA